MGSPEAVVSFHVHWKFTLKSNRKLRRNEKSSQKVTEPCLEVSQNMWRSVKINYRVRVLTFDVHVSGRRPNCFSHFSTNFAVVLDLIDFGDSLIAHDPSGKNH